MPEPSKEALEAADNLAQEYGLQGFERPISRLFDAFAAAARAQERERCAKIADVYDWTAWKYRHSKVIHAPKIIAEEILALTDEPPR